MAGISRPRGRAPGGAARDALTRGDVIEAAIAIIDAHGLDALTMRKLADALGVYPTTLYWHAGNKSQLLAAVCQRVLDEIRPPQVDAVEWDDWITALARSVRAAFHRHPNLAAYFGSQLQVDTTLLNAPARPASTSLSYTESLLQVLTVAGFTGDDLVDAYNTVTACIFGWIAGEFAVEPADDAATDWRQTFEESLYAIDAAQAPTLSRNMGLLANRAFGLRWESGRTNPMDRGFEAAIRTLVRGLRASLPSEPGPAAPDQQP
jgi:AcrR family transcriptional regulator